MQIAGMLLGCLMLGSGSVSGGQPVRPTEIVAEAMMLPVGSVVAGQPVTLLNALGSTADRSRQLQIVRTYWRLTQSVALYHFCHDHAKTLERIKMAGGGDAGLRLAETSAKAQLREAELVAVRTQFELAELMQLPVNSQMPLPADRPLVVPYGTRLNEMFAGRTPPEPARLADKILPLQRQTIDDRAAAVQAADDALTAVTDDLQNSKGSAAAVAECSGELLQQQQAFIETVCGYNRNIADYALMVVAPATTPAQLVAILIGPAQPAVASPASVADRPVRSTGANEPITTAPSWQQRQNEPTLAPRRTGEPTLAPPRPTGEPTPASPPNSLRPVDKNEPPLTSPRSEPVQKPVKIDDQPLVPIDSLPSTSHTANKPTALLADGRSSSAATALYPTLVGATPGVRAKQLTIALHGDRSLPEVTGKPINLADCLLRDGSTNRRATVEAYWLVRQRAAQYQVLVGQLELLDALTPVVLERRSSPSGPTDMLRLRSAQAGTKATMREAQKSLVEAQYGLALRIGAVADAAWPLASTVPHSGSYLLKLDAQPRSLAESWPVRRLAATMPGLGENVQQRAAAVVDADAARVAAAERYAAGVATIDQLLDSVMGQTEQTTAFLESLTAYNDAIAEYATTVLPPSMPAVKLVGALVAKP